MARDPPIKILLVLSSCCIGAVRAQQQLGVAIGNANAGVGDVLRREHYEYRPPGAWGDRQRQRGPFENVIPGIIVTVASSALQWYNEGRAVRDARMLANAKREVVELDSAAPIDPENDGKLIHISGQVATSSGLVDPDHGLNRPNALQLTSTTEAYQWKERRSESRTRVGETQTRVAVEYRYHKEWNKSYVESNRFQSTGHHNPYPRYQLGRNKMTVDDARMSNGFRLQPDLVDQIGNPSFVSTISQHPSLNNCHCKAPVVLGTGEDLPYNGDAVISSNALYFSESRRPSELLALDYGSHLVEVRSPENRIPVVRSAPRAEVGDVRVSWTEVTAPR